MKRSWICTGVPQDNKKYPDQNPPGEHEPYENYGTGCVICGLPKSAVIGRDYKIPISAIAAGIAGVFVLGIGGLAYSLLKPCPSGQQKVNGSCIATDPASPPSPGTVPSTTSPVNPTSSVPQYSKLADVPNVPALRVRYGGSTSMAPLRSAAVLDPIRQAFPSLELQYTEPINEKPGSGSGIRMLLEEQLNLAFSSRPLKPEEHDAAKRQGLALEQIPVAIDGIAVYVHPEVVDSVQGLTLAQLQDIYTGKLTNWKAVGGPDLSIKPFSRDPKDGGTPEFFEDKVLSKQPFGASVRLDQRDTTSFLREVANTPGSIGYATASEVCNQSSVRTLAISKADGQPLIAPCAGNQVNKAEFANSNYPITRNLFVIIRRDGKDSERAGVAYANLLLSAEGQQLVEQAGFVSVRTR